MGWWPCGNSGETKSAPAPVNQWRILYSPGTPDAPDVLGNGFALDFPTAAGSSLHYVVRGASGAIGGAFDAAINLTIPEGVVLNPVGAGDEPPCKAVFYFQRRGDESTASFQHYRWFSRQSLPLISSYSGVKSVSLSPENWGSVFGISGTDAPGDFAAAMADVQAVGMTFGGKVFAGHGLVASGASRIEVSAFNIG